MHLALGSLNMASLRAAVARPLALRRSGVRGRAGTRGVQVRAEIKKIHSPAGDTVDTCDTRAADTCKNVTFKDPPVFDRSTAKTGIMHIGVGGFHRSHQQVCFFFFFSFHVFFFFLTYQASTHGVVTHTPVRANLCTFFRSPSVTIGYALCGEDTPNYEPSPRRFALLDVFSSLASRATVHASSHREKRREARGAEAKVPHTARPNLTFFNLHLFWFFFFGAFSNPFFFFFFFLNT